MAQTLGAQMRTLSTQLHHPDVILGYNHDQLGMETIYCLLGSGFHSLHKNKPSDRMQTPEDILYCQKFRSWVKILSDTRKTGFGAFKNYMDKILGFFEPLSLNPFYFLNKPYKEIWTFL